MLWLQVWRTLGVDRTATVTFSAERRDAHVIRRVLFICTENRARSQMAEGLLRYLSGGRFEVFSAGTEPGQLSPLSIQVMREIGIDISGQWSKGVEEFAGQEFDFVVTVCDSARQACPYFPGNGRRLHWEVADPAEAETAGGDALAAFRTARDDLRGRIEQFLKNEASDSPSRALMGLPWRKRPRLFWSLFRDKRVPMAAKLILPAMGLYLLMPVDLIPDFIPVVGYLDDLLIVIAGLWLFLQFCPRPVFDEHIESLRS
ncbi:MAG: DUF1232 domain-containing protein [Chloroflexi bacterium]|nr:DUF1232 domain-containing protein [Chloroflexota bacterium]